MDPGSGGGVSSMGTITVYVRQPNGSPIAEMAVVTVTLSTQQYFRQLTTQGGSASFEGILAGTYTVQAIAPGYENTTQEVEVVGMNTFSSVDLIMQPRRDASGAVIPGPPMLAPKAQKQLGQALQALREKKLTEALEHLNKAKKLAPSDPEVNYLFGVYYAQTGDWTAAKDSWFQAVKMYPQHVGANLSLGEALYREGNYTDAIAHLSKAILYDSSSWRAQLLYANASLRQASLQDAEDHARRAIDIGHANAASAHLVLADVYHQQGRNDDAIAELRTYLQLRPGDGPAQKALDQLTAPPVAKAAALTETPNIPSLPPGDAVPVVAKWLPPNVDDVTPPVETGVACQLPQVLQHASARVAEFLKNVDRFTATETVRHESVNRWGIVSSTENLKFNYLVSYREVRPHLYAVEEYRDGSLDMGRFPDKIATIGLPSLMLVFEKVQRDNYDMTCEGLTRWHGGLAWQVHFAQKPNKPRLLRSYQTGGRSYPIAIKGRAWISAENYQILRLETDLESAPPALHLAAEHIDVEYGPVFFNGQKDPLWVPKIANIYIDWQGHRLHRQHSYTDFFLFGVEEKYRMKAPKDIPAKAGTDGEGGTKPPA